MSAVCKQNHHLQVGSATNFLVASVIVTGHRQAGRQSHLDDSEDESFDQESDEELAAEEAAERAAAEASREALEWLTGDNPGWCSCAGCTSALLPSAGVTSGPLYNLYTESQCDNTAHHQCSGSSHC